MGTKGAGKMSFDELDIRLKDSIDTLSYDMTIGSGEEVSLELTNDLLKRVSVEAGRELTTDEQRYVRHALSQRENEMVFV